MSAGYRYRFSSLGLESTSSRAVCVLSERTGDLLHARAMRRESGVGPCRALAGLRVLGSRGCGGTAAAAFCSGALLLPREQQPFQEQQPFEGVIPFGLYGSAAYAYPAEAEL